MSNSASGGFVHLHAHTEYSMLDGAARVKELFAEAARMEMPALAITDHGNLFGAYEFWKAGLPKRNPRMRYFLNGFPHAGCKRPVGPESDPHSNLGMTKWLIEELRAEKHVGGGPTTPSTPTK